MTLNSERGAVYVEFLLVFVPMFVLFVSLIQLALILSADILTELSAQKAIRAAVVILGDDHENAQYEEPLHQVGTGESGIAAYRSAEAQSRYQQIRMAARYPLAAVSPALKGFAGNTVASSLAKVDGLDAALSLTGWTQFAVGLGFLNAQGGYVSKFNANENIRVRVVFLFPCFIPIGGNIVCDTYAELERNARDLIEVNGTFARGIGLLGTRFIILNAEATLQNQGRK